MKHTRILAVVMSLLLFLTLVPSMNGATASAESRSTMSGEGTEQSPYIVTTAGQLNEVRDDLSAHYRLDNDIVFSASDIQYGGPFQSWQPIGSSTLPFCGVFDGNGHSIKNLRQNISGNFAGLFGVVSNATIKNLSMEDYDIMLSASSNNTHAGAIVGLAYMNSSILSCNSRGSVYITSNSDSAAFSQCGGIVGQAIETTISDCTNSGSVRATGTNEAHVGGIVGYALNSTITSCSNNGQVSESTTSKSDSVGGIAGRSKLKNVTSCVNEGQILTDSVAGGIVGHMTQGTVSKCYNLGEVGTDEGVDEDDVDCGGIVGIAADTVTISMCYNIGTVSGGVCGGIASALESTSEIQNCYNTVEVRSSTAAGGIVGTVASNSRVNCAYNVGNIDSTVAGGVAAEADNSIFSDCYYLDTTAGKGVGQGTAATTSLTSAEMKSSAGFSGFDFSAVWTMDGKATYDYPELIDSPLVTLKVESISITNEHLSVQVGKSIQLQVEVLPAGADNKAVAWRIDYNESTGSALIDNNGLMTAENVGTVVVVASALDGSENEGSKTFIVAPWEGQGTEELPYLIKTRSDLNRMNNRLFLASHFQLNNDIVFSGTESLEYPIGDQYWPSFSGVFDGNGKVIKGLKIDIASERTNLNIGLFGSVQNGTIKNLGLEGGSISGTATTVCNAGSIVGYLSTGGLVTNCYSTSNVSSSHVAGGIAGYVGGGGRIDNCYYAIGTVSSDEKTGGIAGYCLTGTVSECYTAGNIVNNGFAGAIVGENLGGTVEKCYYLNGSVSAVGEGAVNAVGLSDSQMKTQDSFNKLDFEKTWTMNGSDTYLYPKLKCFYKVDVSTISVQSPSDSVEKTKTLQLSATILPDNASEKKISWSVINGTGSASINQEGLLTAISVGTVTVRATAMDGSEVFGDKTITITPLLVSQITVGSSVDSVTRIYTIQMSAKVMPEQADNRDVVWSVENVTGEASIDQDGLLRGQSPGKVIVKATAKDGSEVVGQKDITILPIYVNSVTIECNSHEVMATRTLQLTASLVPNYADDISVTWSVTNVTGKATINQDGLLLAESVGTAKVRATANGSGAYGEIVITITAEPLYGDANCDGNMDASDASAILRNIVLLENLTPRGMIQGNVNAPYNVEPDAADAAAILRMIVRLISEFPITQLD